MDPTLQGLPCAMIAFIEDQLSNDEVSCDAALLAAFVDHGLSEAQARQALTYRDHYRLNVYCAGFTPIRNPGQVLRFNPHTRQYERA